MRSFSTSGPIAPEKHYHLSPLRRAGADRLLRWIEGSYYFVMYAPRLTGLTSTLIALRNFLNAGAYRAVHVPLHDAQMADDDVERSLGMVLGGLARQALRTLDDDFLLRHWETVLESSGPGDALREALSLWAKASPEPLVLLLDDVDDLHGEGLLAVIHQLRVGHETRPDWFPKSIALCGRRAAADYAIRSSHALNFVVDSERVADFSETEVRALLDQHTAETGQRFTPEAVEEIWNSTHGQPWLVNALADAACFQDARGRDRSREITRDAISSARERWLANLPNRFEPVIERLREERVRRSIEPLLTGSRQRPPFETDDLLYLRDTGLLVPAPPPRIANPIYREVMARSLTTSTG